MGSDEGLEVWAVAATKAKYFRYTDTGRWDDLRSLFTDDAEFELPFMGKFEHVDIAIRTVQERIGDEWSFHASSIPEISIVSPTEATGIFAMFSHAKKDDSDELGRMFGYYYDEFRKVEGKWLISSLKLISSYRNMFGFKHQATDLADTVL
jgi:SnoaL-like domain